MKMVKSSHVKMTMDAESAYVGKHYDKPDGVVITIGESDGNTSTTIDITFSKWGIKRLRENLNELLGMLPNELDS